MEETFKPLKMGETQSDLQKRAIDERNIVI